MARGDHLYVYYPAYTHHGIESGDGKVIHLSQKYGTVTEITLEKFAAGRLIYKKDYHSKCDVPEKVIERAKSLLYREKYCLFTNNCEHFAYWCKTGKKKSEQINNQVALTAGVAVQASTLLAVKLASKTASQLAVKIAGKTAAGMAGAGGLITSLATDAVISQMLEDDEFLHQTERNAREAGRWGATVGSTLGGIAGTAAAAIIGGSGAIAVAVTAPVIFGVATAAAFYNWKKEDELSIEFYE